MAHEHKWATFTSSGQDIAQLEIQLIERSRHWPWIAPPIAGTIVRTYARARPHTLLYERPIRSDVAEAGFDDDGRCSMSAAVKVKSMTAHVDDTTGRRQQRKRLHKD